MEVTYKTVDTCAAEFSAETPYHYGTYEDEDEVAPLTRPAVVILGSGPNRIGQGVEFDYCCVHAAFALSDAGLRDGHAQLQPRDRLHRLRHQRPPLLRAALPRGRAGRLPTPAGARRGGRGVAGRRGGRARRADAAQAGPDAGERRHPGARHQSRLDRPRRGPRALPRALHPPRHRAAARRHRRSPPRRRAPSPTSSGYPVLVRPSYVLGGRAMQIVYDEPSLDAAMEELAAAGSLGREGGLSAERPVLVDRFLEDAIEVDVDAHPRRDRRRRDRRRHGAHRGGRRALRRLRVRDPAADAVRRHGGAHRDADPRARRRARRARPAQRAVRGEGRRAVRDRGQPARQPHGAVREQGDGRARWPRSRRG